MGPLHECSIQHMRWPLQLQSICCLFCGHAMDLSLKTLLHLFSVAAHDCTEGGKEADCLSRRGLSVCKLQTACCVEWTHMQLLGMLLHQSRCSLGDNKGTKAHARGAISSIVMSSCKVAAHLHSSQLTIYGSKDNSILASKSVSRCQRF